MRHFAMGFLVGLLLLSVAYAATVQQIWNSVFDSANDAIRINQVTP